MIDLFSMLVESAMPLLIALGLAVFGALGFFVHGKRKKAEGRKEERRRADEARADAKANAEVIREQAAKTPVENQRKEVSKWEK